MHPFVNALARRSLSWRLGQVETPQPLVDLLLAFCLPREAVIQGRTFRVLDPGCGSGAFLRGALRRVPHAEVWGVDLAADELAKAPPEARRIQADFLSWDPGIAFDAVVGNPPFVRQEAIQKPAGFPLIKRAGLHGYFLLRALSLLRPGGRLGFVLPAAWLETAYGGELQQELIRRCRRLAIVESACESWFPAASINACLVVAEVGGPAEQVHFLRLSAPVEQLNPETFWDDVFARGRSIPRQQALAEPRWSRFLRAPDIWFEILATRPWVPLGEVAEVRFAQKTGANAFFCLPAHADIEPEYLQPLVYSLRDCPAIRIRLSNLRRRLLMAGDVQPGSRAWAYIQSGEAQGLHLRKTCRARRPWYALPPREPWPVLYPERTGVRFLCPWNGESCAQVNKNLYEIRPRPGAGISALALCALLNTTWVHLAHEVSGRVLVGKQEVIDIDVQAVSELPLPPPPADLRPLEQALQASWDRPVGPAWEAWRQPERRALDRMALAPWNLDDEELDQIGAAVETLVLARSRQG